MSPYRYFNLYADNNFNCFDRGNIKFLKAPSGYHFRGYRMIPLLFDNNEEIKSSFISTLNSLNYHYHHCKKVVIGKNVDGQNRIYIGPCYAFSIDPVTREKKLMYITCEKEGNTTYTDRVFKLLIPSKFVFDTKNLWLNGLKTHIFGPFLGYGNLEIEICDNLEQYIVTPKKPTSADYYEEVDTFLKSDYAGEKALEFLG